jgi:murein DD-endopeptidase MepM/ murein hydrolase activator NlpD
VLRRFVAPLGPYGPGHRGVDLWATPGSPVLAVEGGVVTHAGPVAGRGTVTVRHAGGLSSTYEPVSAEVAVGDPVSAGDVVGMLAATGADAGAAAGHCGVAGCLHLGARRGATYVDPLLLLLGGGVRLLPLRGGQTTG